MELKFFFPVLRITSPDHLEGLIVPFNLRRKHRIKWYVQGPPLWSVISQWSATCHIVVTVEKKGGGGGGVEEREGSRKNKNPLTLRKNR